MTISSVIIISSLVIMGINIGENTHHQLQVIVLVSFRIRNIRNNIVPNPSPLSLFLDTMLHFCIIKIRSLF